MIEVLPGVTLDEDEIVVTASRSGGPGGQHVNKTSTRVAVTLDVNGSRSLTADQKRVVLERLGSRVHGGGAIRVVSQGSRSQHANRQDAIRRLVALLADALTPREPRVASRVPAAEKRRRLDAKRRRGSVKEGRRSRREEDRADPRD